MGWLPYILHIMINLKEGFNKLLKDIQESSPNFKKTLKEISPISFCISLKGHKKIFISINDNRILPLCNLYILTSKNMVKGTLNSSNKNP